MVYPIHIVGIMCGFQSEFKKEMPLKWTLSIAFIHILSMLFYFYLAQ